MIAGMLRLLSRAGRKVLRNGASVLSRWVCREPSADSGRCRPPGELLDLLADPMVEIDSLGSVLRWNPAFGAWADTICPSWDRDRILRMMFCRPRELSLMLAAFHDEEPFSGSMEIIGAKGTVPDVSVRGIPTSFGGAWLLFTPPRAMSERDSSLRWAKLAHEVRSPLTAILGFTDLLESAMETAKSARSSADFELIEAIRRNARYMASLAQDILIFSKAETNEVRLEWEEVPIDHVLHDVEEAFRDSFRSRNLGLSVHAVGVLPPTIRTDTTRLRQIISNLVGNALKFTKAGHVDVVACLGPSSEAGPTLRITVSDTGIGMDRETRERIFEPFYQGGGHQIRNTGVGLGLSIARQLTRSLGGTIEVSSQLGVGTTFTVTLPIGSLDGVVLSASRREGTPSPQIADSRQRLSGRRILLVEDSPDSQRLFCHWLRGEGASVVTADDGAKGRNLAIEDQPFDLILMDIDIPIINGCQASREIRAHGVKVPIVALSAYDALEFVGCCPDGSFTDQLSKPLKKDLLIETIARVILEHPSPCEPSPVHLSS